MSTKALSAGRRRDLIHDVLAVRGFATVRDLARLAGVSDMTVRRDLDTLIASGAVRRVHGGAESLTRSRRVALVPEPAYAERMRAHEGAKRRIAQHAAARVADGDTVALDGSTTVTHLARALRDRPVTLLTNNLLVADVAVGSVAHVHLVGGTVRPETRTMVGAATLAALADLHADVVFLSCTGLDADAGMTDGNPDEIAVKRALMTASKRAVALVDASKFGRRSLQTLALPGAVDRIIVDQPPDPPLAAALLRHGTVLEVAGGAGDAPPPVAPPHLGDP